MNLISIITPCFNSENTIRQTLESVLNQSYQNFEYIIIDGASTDDTLNIINEYKILFGEKLRIFSEPDDGIYDAMNKGISKAKGSIVGIINSDDWYELNTLELINQNYTGAKYEILYGMQKNWENEKEKIVFIKSHEFIDTQMLTHPTCFVTKSTYSDLGCFDLSYKSSADYELMIRMVKSGKVHFTPIHQIMANFRMGGMSSGQIGVREDANIRYHYGIISKKKMIFTIFKSLAYEIMSKRKLV
ncbi:glycosyltransferase family 2 protein [Bacillus sp. UNC41MFS5]|uniref:glycosyltransferase family 2 protein n=1 Tax=Bacillus sp. UNC41MFS5 TaxID=1449046 RepID=UPI00047E062C|nr:glycosyltransferase family 2 protein [Bacillus sp. UNC41MFS5]